MFAQEYRFKFYLNARHSIYGDKFSSNIHPHTWEIVLYIVKKTDDFVLFSHVEKKVEGFLSVFEGKYLNEVPDFRDVNPTMENIGEIFSEQIDEILDADGWELKRLEISENPSRTFTLTKIGENTPAQQKRPVEAKGFEVKSSKSDLDKPVEKAAEVQVTQYLSDDNGDLTAETEIKSEQDKIETESRDGHDNDHTRNTTGQAAGNVSNIRDTSNNGDNSSIINISGLSNISNTGYIVLGLILVGILAVLTVLFINRGGAYPWGSDTWGHIAKADFLYKEVLSGNFFPLFSDKWYNGIQPFRYWAPLPYYILLLFELVTKGNSFLTYDLFIIFTFVAGAAGWLFWGIKYKRRALAIAIAILWFFLPDNLRVLFSEGNIPRVVVTILFPYVLLAVWSYFETKENKQLLLIVLYMVLICLNHAMIAAMAAITIFIFAAWYAIANRNMKSVIYITLSVAIGILISGIWLYPALKGGMLSLDQDSVSEVMKGYTFNAAQSLNPLHRFGNKEDFYFGVSIFIIALVGMLFGCRKSRAGFGVLILIFFGTTKEVAPILVKIPFSQMLWTIRFVPLAMGAFFTGLLMWKKLGRRFLALAIVLIALDGMISFKLLGSNRSVPEDVKHSLDQAASAAAQRVAVLDLSSFASYPSYYLAFGETGKDVQQVYGWAWQGATTSSNIVQLNTALEKGWYPFLLDRSLELGADTLVVKKALIKSGNEFEKSAQMLGYAKYGEDKLSVIYKYPVDTSFGTSVDYKGLGIGEYARNMAYIFPVFEVGESTYIDDYTVERFLRYDVVFISGFRYRDKEKAERIVKFASEMGVKFIVDLTNAHEDLNTSRASFLGVVAEPILFKDAYPTMNIGSRRLDITEGFPEEYREWRTIQLENTDEIMGEAEFQNQIITFLGTKINENIVFVGLNLPFYAMETGDKAAIDILENITGFETDDTPKRKVVEIRINREGNSMTFEAQQDNTVTSLAYLDSFRFTEGDYDKVHNLILMKDRRVTLKIVYPYLVQGLILTIIGLTALSALFVFIDRPVFRSTGEIGARRLESHI